MKRTLNALLRTACSPDNVEVFLRKALAILSGPEAFGPKAAIAVIPGDSDLPAPLFRNFSREEQRLLLAGKAPRGGRWLKAALPSGDLGRGRLAVRLPAAGGAADKLKAAAQLLKARLTQELRDRAFNRERDLAAAVRHVEELYLACPGISLKELSRTVLDEARRLTGSPTGFAGYIDPASGLLVAPTLSGPNRSRKYRAKDRPLVFKEFTGLWGWVLKKKKPLLANSARTDPRAAGAPAGHFTFDRFLGVPAVYGGRLLGMLALADAAAPYRDRDLAAAAALAHVYAVILQRTLEEARQAEESDERLRIITSSQDIIYSADPAGHFIYVSPRVRDYGYDPEELKGRSVLEFAHPDDREYAKQAFARAIRTGKTVPVLTYRLLRKDGSSFCVEQKSGVIKHAGKPALITGVIRDVTWKFKAEAELKEREAKYRELVESLNDVLFMLDSKGVITYISPQIRRISGFRPEELTGRRFQELVHREDLAELNGSFRKLLRGKMEPSEFRWHTKDGGVRWARSSSRPFVENGKVIGIRGILSDITGQKLLENTFKENEQRLNLILSQINGVLWVLDKDLRFTMSRGKGLVSLGLKPDQIVGMKLEDYMLPAGPDSATLKAARRALRGESVVYEEKFGGAAFSLMVSPMTDLGGRITGVIGVAMDNTEQKAMEQQLKESERFLDSVVDNIPNMVFVKDAKHLRFFRLNKAAEQLLGFKEADLIGTNDYDHFPKKEADFFVKADRQVLAGGKLLDIPEETIHTAHGERTLHTRKIPIADNAGKPLYLLGISEDITEKKRLETVVRENERTLSTIFDSVTDLMFILDTEGRYVRANKACAAMFGVEPEYMRGKTESELFGAVVEERFSQENAEVLRTGRTMTYTRERRFPAGTFYINIIKIPMKDEAGRIAGILCVARDITAVKKMESELALAKAAAVLSKVARPMAHDFNNALTAIVGYATLIDDELKPDNPIKHEIAQIVKAVKRAEDLTSKFQTFARDPKLRADDKTGPGGQR